jgi:hypothetical protein
MKRFPGVRALRPKVATIQSIVPAYIGAVQFSEDELDQLSALLSDYLAFSHSHVAMLESCKALTALELVNQWRTQAADLRERIEGRE